MVKSCTLLVLVPHHAKLTVYRSLELPALVAAIKALQTLADRRVSLSIDSQPKDEAQAGPTTPVSSSPSEDQLPYDPTSVFLLEIMVSIAVHTSEHIEETW